MAESLKVLGQSAPAAATLTTLYTVPAATSAVGSSLVICNRGAGQVLVRVAVRPAGAGIANQHYLLFDVPVLGNTTITLTIGFTLATTDVVSVQSDLAQTSFTLFGSEVA